MSNPVSPLSEENDPLWDLLARSSRPEPDAWFVTRTLARCRDERVDGKSSRALLVRASRWALGFSVCATLALAIPYHGMSKSPAKQKSVQEAFEIMANMEPDSDSSSTTSTWQDTSL